MLAAGVPVTLNADDPTEFGVSMLDEYCRAEVVFGLPDETMADIATASVTASGASVETKRRILAGIAAWRDHYLPAPASPSRTEVQSAGHD